MKRSNYWKILRNQRNGLLKVDKEIFVLIFILKRINRVRRRGEEKKIIMRRKKNNNKLIKNLLKKLNK